jgi:hypothetical protein
MTRVDEIKVAIGKLSLTERGELERWLHGWIDDEWDKQIAADAGSGRLDKLLAEVDREIDQGELRDFP